MLSAVDGTNNINYVTGATYGPDSALTGYLNGGGITNKFLYTPRLQPCRMAAATGGTLPANCLDSNHGNVMDLGYDFHAGNGTAGSGTDNGNVYGLINYKDPNRSQTFTYDPLNRLLSAQNAGTNCALMTVNNKTEYWGNNYSYDAWGNLLGKAVTKCGAENMSLTADAHNWIHASGTDYQYDAAGNMTFNATANQSYTFDQENRLTGASGYTYTYDGDGNRVRKSNGNTASSGTLYWYMSPGVVAETDLAGTTKSEYVFFDGERVARRDGVNGAGGVFYYFSDHLKTASIVTDASGVIKADSDYYPWGGELQFVNNDTNDYKFTGKKRDLETGLDYFGARYYSNGLGRWVSADWSVAPVPVPYADFGDPQTLNLYQFVGGNPASKVDASGHCFWDLCVAETYLAVTGAVVLTAAALSTPAGQQAIKAGAQIADHATAWAATGIRNLFSSKSKAHATPAPVSGAVPGTQAKADARPGTLGKPDHQATVKAEADRIGGKTEVKIPTPTGSKDYRRADAVGTNSETGAPEIVQVYRPTPAGNIPKREQDAARDIEEATGVKPTMVPVRPVPGKQDGSPK